MSRSSFQQTLSRQTKKLQVFFASCSLLELPPKANVTEVALCGSVVIAHSKASVTPFPCVFSGSEILLISGCLIFWDYDVTTRNQFFKLSFATMKGSYLLFSRRSLSSLFVLSGNQTDRSSDFTAKVRVNVFLPSISS